MLHKWREISFQHSVGQLVNQFKNWIPTHKVSQIYALHTLWSSLTKVLHGYEPIAKYDWNLFSLASPHSLQNSTQKVHLPPHTKTLKPKPRPERLFPSKDSKTWRGKSQKASPTAARKFSKIFFCPSWSTGSRPSSFSGSTDSCAHRAE